MMDITSDYETILQLEASRTRAKTERSMVRNYAMLYMCYVLFVIMLCYICSVIFAFVDYN